MVAEKQAEEVAEIAEAVVHRGCGHEQHARTDHEPCERAIAPRAWVPEAVGLVDDPKAATGGRGRQWAVRRRTQRLMREDRCLGPVLFEQRPPLVHQHRRDDQRERRPDREGDCERDVRLAEANGVCEQGAAVAREDADESRSGRGLMRGEPRRPWRLALERERREVEQRARPDRRDGRRGRDRAGREEAG